MLGDNLGMSEHHNLDVPLTRIISYINGASI